MRGILLLGIFLACALCHAQTNNPSAARFVFNGFERAPDGRLAYLFTSQNSAETNRVFMGESIAGRQLLSFSPNTRTLTLATSNGSQTLLAAGDSFLGVQGSSPAIRDDNLQGWSPAPSGLRLAGLQTTVTRSSMVSIPPPRGRGVVHQNDFFFGNEYMYPTRFEVRTFPVASPDGRTQHHYPVVIPRDFRTGRSGIQGTTRTQ